MKKNIVEKIWDSHLIDETSGLLSVCAIDFIFLHEVTSAQAFQTLKDRNIDIMFPNQCIATIDHSIPTRKNRTEIYDAAARNQVELLRENAHKNNIAFYDFESGYQGIVHVIGPELGITQPGMTIICGDSHTATHGAFGTLAFGVGTSELSHALASGCLLLSRPKVMKVEFKGNMQKGVFAKDLIMKLISQIGIGGGTGFVIEYTGQVIQQMSMEERMTICNMSIECGAKAGLISPDSITYQYLSQKSYAPHEENWNEMVQYWDSFRSDESCFYDHEISIDVQSLEPMITWGTNPSQAIGITKAIPKDSEISPPEKVMYAKALEYMKLQGGENLEGVPIDWAFIGSCTNGRIEDLRICAKIIQNKKVHPSVTLFIVPGSENVLKQAKKEGLDKIFIDAGADFRMPGCSLCLGMNDDKVPAGKRCISSTNRNFVGRQGTGSYTHLASPATVIASAIEGKISSPIKFF
ncbi:3-isopropylmalate dehydratase large subunit [Fluviispira multicolorata]|uniref:3-isopropylmalate dehydratase n=1 Tax=Fluviispira multicolorata TaxID=2654512 RepID=A0A833JEE0_9BACT|nr:3-isopropylmalate dehydratase large subunit [Fluviispira multicolorata]KAB8033169.1 3-isopropylmalate dehydratase large subunit [Fluviispira multicolorata]